MAVYPWSVRISKSMVAAISMLEADPHISMLAWISMLALLLTDIRDSRDIACMDPRIYATKDIHIPISLLPRISMLNTGIGYPNKHGYP